MDEHMTATAEKIQPANSLKKPRVVMFDWDDTIVDNWDTAFAALNAALTHMGVPAWTAEEARRRSGPSAKDMFTGLFGDRWQEADRVYYDTFMSLVLKNIIIHDQAENFLKLLREKGVKTAVVSNKRAALLHNEVQHIGFRPYFDAVVGAGDAKADKPDPAPLLLALEQCGAPAGDDVWYIGDSHTDMIAAHKAGCAAVLIETKVPPEDLLRDHPPHGRFGTHQQMIDYVNKCFS